MTTTRRSDLKQDASGADSRYDTAIMLLVLRKQRIKRDAESRADDQRHQRYNATYAGDCFRARVTDIGSGRAPMVNECLPATTQLDIHHRGGTGFPGLVTSWSQKFQHEAESGNTRWKAERREIVSDLVISGRGNTAQYLSIPPE